MCFVVLSIWICFCLKKIRFCTKVKFICIMSKLTFYLILLFDLVWNMVFCMQNIFTINFSVFIVSFVGAVNFLKRDKWRIVCSFNGYCLIWRWTCLVQRLVLLYLIFKDVLAWCLTLLGNSMPWLFLLEIGM